MKKLFTRSLHARLIAGFIVLLLAAWATASITAWYHTSKSLNKLFDTQQLLFAKRLSALDFTELHAEPQLARSKHMLPHHRGKQDDDTLAFAIFRTDGQLVLNDGDNGKSLDYHYRRDGFMDGQLKDDDDEWRLLWLTTADGKYRIVVGQEWEYREEMALDIVLSQLTPWLIALPVMLLLLVWLVSRTLAPVYQLTGQLRKRSPDEASRIDTQHLPVEIEPLVSALNQLFARTEEYMLRERRFTSDAAHELRSPLAALKVQTEVARLAGDDTPVREHALNNLLEGIGRATRLVDQLLILSRLDSLSALEDVKTLSLAELLQSAVMDAWLEAQREGIDIRLILNDEQVFLRGQPLLLGLMVRNALDNAVRYSPKGSVVNVVLNRQEICITDNGPGIDPAFLPNLGERFFRPAGQEQTGSGLGLSIIQRIAALHGIKARFSNASLGGFKVSICW